MHSSSNTAHCFRRAFGATGYFFEVHPTPDLGLSDAANMLELEKLDALVRELTIKN